MSLFSSLFKTKKINAAPAIVPLSPEQINPGMYGSLSDLAKKYMQGPGFGNDFVDKATNPAIANIDYNFQHRTMPTLSSELSKRGIARSVGPGLASDVIGQADQQRNMDINNLISQFTVMNEQQKKNDVQFGSGLGQNILSGDVAAQQRQAESSQHIQDVTNADVRQREALDASKAGNILQAGAQLAVPALGGLSSITGSIPGLGGLSDLLSKAQGGMQTMNTARTQTLNNLDYSKLESILKSIGAI